jgi:hypothetical protein
MPVQQVSTGNPDGVCIGQSITDKVGFFGVTPITQPTAPAETLVTDNSGGVANAATAVNANVCKQVVTLGVQLSDLAAGNFKVAMPNAFTLQSIGFRTAKPASTASKAVTLQAAINGVNCTGGVINLTTANQNTIGGFVAGTPITAGNVGTAGQTLEVNVSAVTAFVEGDGWVEFTVLDNDLANTISTLIAADGGVRNPLVNLGLIKGS